MDTRRLRRLLIALALAAPWHPADAGRLRVLVQTAPLAGFQFHEGSRLWPQLQVGDVLELRREPANRHDTRAIAVRWRGEMLGYLPRAENDAVSEAMDRGVTAEARIAALRDERDPWRRVQVEVFLVMPRTQ